MISVFFPRGGFGSCNRPTSLLNNPRAREPGCAAVLIGKMQPGFPLSAFWILGFGFGGAARAVRSNTKQKPGIRYNRF